MNNFHKGFISPRLLALIAILIIGGGAYVYVHNKPVSQPAVVSPTAQATSTGQTSNSQTADWKTYTNSQYGFEIFYPPSWSEESTRDLTIVRLVSQQTQGTDTNANLFQNYFEVSGVYRATCKNLDWVSSVNSVTTQFVKIVCRPGLKMTISMKATSEDARKLEDTILSTLKLNP